MNQLDLFSTPPPVPTEAVPVAVPKLLTRREQHLQAKADWYLSQMSRLADLAIRDPQPHLRDVRSREMNRFARLRQETLEKLKCYEPP